MWLSRRSASGCHRTGNSVPRSLLENASPPPSSVTHYISLLRRITPTQAICAYRSSPTFFFFASSISARTSIVPFTPIAKFSATSATHNENEEEENDGYNNNNNQRRYASRGGASSSTYVSHHFQLDSPNTVRDFLQRKHVELRDSHSHVIVKTCPACHTLRNNTDQYKLYIAKNTGAYLCHRCGTKGSWFDLKRLFGGGDISFASMGHSSYSPSSPSPSSPPPPPKFPDQALVGHYPEKLWTEHTNVARWLVGKRSPSTSSVSSATETPSTNESTTTTPNQATEPKPRQLSVDVLKLYKVGATSRQFKDATGEGYSPQDCVTFPWIDVDNFDKPLEQRKETITRIKLRSMTHKNNQRIEPSGGSWGLFGWHTVPPHAKEIVLTEGEFDAMAVHQATGMPAVSLPNGANSLPVDLLPRLERFEKIYLWLDDDDVGHAGADKFAKKLGTRRCRIVNTKDGEVAGPKDANDALIAGKDLKALIAKAVPPRHNQLLTFSDLRKELVATLSPSNASKVAGVPLPNLPLLTKIIKGHRPGELTIFTGATGVGKTSFLSQMSLDLARSGVRTLWGSFEMKNVTMLRKMLTQFCGHDISRYSAAGREGDLDKIMELFEALPIYWMKFFGSTEVDSLIEAMEHAVYVYDIQHILLDNLQFVLSGQSLNASRFAGKYDMQDYALDQFRRFATENNVHVTLVIHPRKQDDDAPLGAASVFGSVKATQEADNVVILQKGKAFKYLDVRKNRYDGALGSVFLRWDNSAQRYSEVNLPPQESQSGGAPFKPKPAVKRQPTVHGRHDDV